MLPGNFVNLGERRDVLEFFAEHLAVWKPPRIRHETCAHGPDRLVFPTPLFDRELTVPLNQLPLLGEGGRNTMFAGG